MNLSNVTTVYAQRGRHGAVGNPARHPATEGSDFGNGIASDWENVRAEKSGKKEFVIWPVALCTECGTNGERAREHAPPSRSKPSNRETEIVSFKTNADGMPSRNLANVPEVHRVPSGQSGRIGRPAPKRAEVASGRNNENVYTGQSVPEATWTNQNATKVNAPFGPNGSNGRLAQPLAATGPQLEIEFVNLARKKIVKETRPKWTSAMRSPVLFGPRGRNGTFARNHAVLALGFAIGNA